MHLSCFPRRAVLFGTNYSGNNSIFQLWHLELIVTILMKISKFNSLYTQFSYNMYQNANYLRNYSISSFCFCCSRELTTYQTAKEYGICQEYGNTKHGLRMTFRAGLC